MKVSLIFPSRNRAVLAAQSLESLGDGDYEVLMAIDEDEPNEEAYTAITVGRKNLNIYITPRHGYQNLHEYYNLLAENSKGDWLMLWNDDAIMETKNWVDIIAKEDHTIPQVLNVWNPIDNLFPLISRAWYEAVGHFARNTHADSWVQQVADIDGRSHFVPDISIKHHGEELNDETHTEVRQIVRQTSEAYRRMGEQRLEDARKISDYIARGESEGNN